MAWELIQAFLSARFTGEKRHKRRLQKITSLEGDQASGLVATDDRCFKLPPPGSLNVLRGSDAMDIILHWIAQYGYPALFALLMLGIVGLPVPDETILTFAGYLVFKHELALMPTIAVAFLGSICGVTISYGIGRSLGPYLVRTVGHALRIRPEDLEQVRGWYVRWGKYTLVLGYFVPGVRHLAALVAGSSKLPLTVFMPFAYSGGLIWSGAFIALGYALGEEWGHTSPAIHRLLAIGAGAVFVTLAILFVRRMRRTP